MNVYTKTNKQQKCTQTQAGEDAQFTAMTSLDSGKLPVHSDTYKTA